MADYKSCVKHDMDLCPMARRFANDPRVTLDCSKCKSYRSIEKQCGDCKYYDARDAYCGIKHESIFFREKSAACYYYEERQEEMSMEKICNNCIAFGADGICRQTESRLFGKERCYYETCENWIAKMSDEPDNVNHPAHYTSGGIECIDCIKAALGENFIGFLIGNVIKYSYRYKDKNGIEDLKKAKWYLERAIKEVSEDAGTDD